MATGYNKHTTSLMMRSRWYFFKINNLLHRVHKQTMVVWNYLNIKERSEEGRDKEKWRSTNKRNVILEAKNIWITLKKSNNVSWHFTDYSLVSGAQISSCAFPHGWCFHTWTCIFSWEKPTMIFISAWFVRSLIICTHKEMECPTCSFYTSFKL